MSSSYSRSWISERLQIEITLPSHEDNDDNSDALFIHPKVAVYEVNKRHTRISSPGALGVCRIAPPPPHHHSMVVLNNVLPAPLRVPDGDKPLLMVGEDRDEFFHGEVGSLVRNLIIHKLIAHSNMKTFTMSADPSVRFVAVVTAISIPRRLDTTAPLTSHLPEAIRGDEDAREGNICLPPSSKSATKMEENTVSTATTSAAASSSTSEAEDEMLRVLEPLWSFKSNMREATFRHSRSQQVPVTEAFLQKLGFAAGSFTLSSTTTAGSSTESQLGVQSTQSSQCGQSVSDFDDDDDELVDHGEDIEVIHHPIHATNTHHHHQHRISSPESVTSASIDTMLHM